TFVAGFEVRGPLLEAARRPPTPEDQRDHGQDHEHDQQDLRYPSGVASDATESEHRGDERDDQKNHGPTNHVTAPTGRELIAEPSAPPTVAHRVSENRTQFRTRRDA